VLARALFPLILRLFLIIPPRVWPAARSPQVITTCGLLFLPRRGPLTSPPGSAWILHDRHQARATAISTAKAHSDGMNEPCTRLDHCMAKVPTTAICPPMFSMPCEAPSGAG